MNLTENTQAILLLTTYFSKPVQGAAIPLTPTEWGRFAIWLHEKKSIPAELLKGDIAKFLASWQDKKITISRIEELLARGHALALAIEKWSRAGIWVLTRSDKEYPAQLRQRLKPNAPPIFFGCGNIKLLNCGGIAVIGSRNITEADLQFTDQLGEKVSSASKVIISGAARGVDAIAMLSALRAGGQVIGVLSDSLLKAATAQKWREGLMNNDLVLISAFYPEAGFNVGNAMARNKYIYCLSDAAIIVHSGKKGGTWAGALENIKKQWVPTWVKPTADPDAGNSELVAQGARWCAESIEQLAIDSLHQQIVAGKENSQEGQTQDLFSIDNKVVDTKGKIDTTINQLAFDIEELSPEGSTDSEQEPLVVISHLTGQKDDKATTAAVAIKDNVNHETTKSKAIATIPIIDSDEVNFATDKNRVVDSLKEASLEHSDVFAMTFYQLFLQQIKLITLDIPLSTDQIMALLQLQKGQLTLWLKQAESEGFIQKLNRPVRYQWVDTSSYSQQFSLPME